MKKLLPIALTAALGFSMQAQAVKPIETKRMVEIDASGGEAKILPGTLQNLVCKYLPQYCATPVKFFYPESFMFAESNTNTYYAFGVNDPIVIKIEMTGFIGSNNVQGMSVAKVSYADMTAYNKTAQSRSDHYHSHLASEFKIDSALYPVAGNPVIESNVWAAALLRDRIDGGNVTEADFIRVDFVDAGSQPQTPYVFFRHIPFSPEPAGLNMKPTLQISYDYKGTQSKYDWVFKQADRQWQRYNGLGKNVLNLTNIKLYFRSDKGWGSKPHAMDTYISKGLR